MLLDIFFYERYPFNTILIKRNMISLNIIKRFSKYIQKKPISNNFNKLKSEIEKKKILLNKILKDRQRAIIRIQSHIRKILIYKQYKKYIIIKNLLQERNKFISLIQSTFRTFIIHKHFKNMLKNKALFFYKFPLDLINKLSLTSNLNEDFKQKSKNKELKLSMQIKSSKSTFEFKYSKYLDSYYLPINKIKSFKKHIYITFKVNGENFLDPRYSIINDNNDNFYNIITNKMIYRKAKKFLFQQKVEEEKKWEELFILKKNRTLSCDSSSINSNTDISKELNVNLGNQNMILNNCNLKKKKMILKPILKNQNIKMKKDVCKKVSFNEKIEFCK